MKKSKRREFGELAVLLVVILALKSSIVTLYQIPTGSMIPTIMPGDRVIADQRAYGWRIPFTKVWLSGPRMPTRGDVAVFPSPVADYDLIKRIVAIGGDRVEIRGGRLMINDTPVKWDGEPQPKADGTRHVTESQGSADDGSFRSHVTRLDDLAPQMRDFGPIVVPEGMFLGIGDNRDHSGDGRVFGPVPMDRLLGRAHIVVFSLNWDQFPFVSFSRSGSDLD